jgi:iron complex transport system substrate-binding protein
VPAHVDRVFAAGPLASMRALVPEEMRPRVCLARGPDGLETGLKG